jgi:dTMP kinase
MNTAKSKGLFIVVEGLEGAGKSTALHTIQHVLEHHSIEFITAREPGGTRVGEMARCLIKEIIPEEPLDPRAELLLFYAARMQLIENVIRPALARGVSVLLDRFELSTFAYQGGGRKLDETMISNLSHFCIVDIMPDLILFLDVPPQQGLQRIVARGEIDRIEQEALEFFNDVHNAYHKHIKNRNNVIVIDASKPQLDVQQSIRDELNAYLMKTC